MVVVDGADDEFDLVEVEGGDECFEGEVAGGIAAQTWAWHPANLIHAWFKAG
jgi:hypothetical protein